MNGQVKRLYEVTFGITVDGEDSYHAVETRFVVDDFPAAVKAAEDYIKDDSVAAAEMVSAPDENATLFIESVKFKGEVAVI